MHTDISIITKMENQNKSQVYIISKVYILLIVAMSCLSCTAQDNEKNTLISDITIISTSFGNVTSTIGYVLIKGDKIKYVGNEKPKVSDNLVEINGTGKFLIPGLIDSHVHLANTAGFNGKLKNKYPELVDAYFEQLPKSYLYQGFTTLVDVNNYYPELVTKIKNSPYHPDIFTCGNQVKVMNDFEMEMQESSLESRYQSSFLHDKYNKGISFPDSINLNEHTPKRIIDDIKAQNGIGVKIVYEDEASGLQVSWAKPSKDIISDLVKEAQKQNIPVLMHAPSIEGHQMGLNAGIQIFAHGLWNWTDNFGEELNNLVLTEEHKEVLQEIAQKQLGYQLTFRAITGEQDLISKKMISDDHLKHIYPKRYLEILKSEEGDWGRKKILGRSDFLKRTNPSAYNAMKGNHVNDKDMWPALYILYKSRLNIVSKFLAERDANFIFGSDTPAMNMFTNPPGYNGFLEMKHMFEAGISLDAIFKAATFNNAKAFHLETLYGGVEKGKKANLLILKSNPLKNINAYNNIETVIIGGELIPREEFSATNNVYE